jgi:hypothetical protein
LSTSPASSYIHTNCSHDWHINSIEPSTQFRVLCGVAIQPSSHCAICSVFYHSALESFPSVVYCAAWRIRYWCAKITNSVLIPVHHCRKDQTTSKPSLKHSFQSLLNAAMGMRDSPSAAIFAVANTSSQRQSPPPDHPVKEPSKSSKVTSMRPFLTSDGRQSNSKTGNNVLRFLKGHPPARLGMLPEVEGLERARNIRGLEPTSAGIIPSWLQLKHLPGKPQYDRLLKV